MHAYLIDNTPALQPVFTTKKNQLQKIHHYFYACMIGSMNMSHPFQMKIIPMCYCIGKKFW